MPWDPFLMKKLIKNEICGSMNSARMHCSLAPPKTRENKKKKKKKERKKQNAASHKRRRSLSAI